MGIFLGKAGNGKMVTKGKIYYRLVQKVLHAKKFKCGQGNFLLRYLQVSECVYIGI